MNNIVLFFLGLATAGIFIALFWKQLRYRRERMLIAIKGIFQRTKDAEKNE